MGMRLIIAGLMLLMAAQVNAQTFNYPEETRPTSLLPFFTDDMSSVRMTELIFDSLVFENKRGDYIGGLATSWKIDPDKRGIRFVLRDGVTWHDGRPFSADDVVFTIKAAQDPKTVFAEKGNYRFVREVKAEGKYGSRWGRGGARARTIALSGSFAKTRSSVMFRTRFWLTKSAAARPPWPSKMHSSAWL